jgi:hypothetical protein
VAKNIKNPLNTTIKCFLCPMKSPSKPTGIIIMPIKKYGIVTIAPAFYRE